VLRLSCFTSKCIDPSSRIACTQAIPHRQDDKGEETQARRDPRLSRFQLMEKELEELAAGRDKSRRSRNRKRDGEAAEAAFLNKATSFGFEVAKPWGDTSRFDFIVHSGSRCWRVQVKSTRAMQHQHYAVTLRRRGNAYSQDEIDFLVFHVVPINTWYVFPVEVICGKSSVTVSPRRGSRSRFELFREAWCLMACPRDGKCNPEISVWRRCLASENGECSFHRKTAVGPDSTAAASGDT
jgi:PD-(D/E)XK endonuclease